MNDSCNSNNSVRIFVGSANLGNAQPDEDSLAAWLPPDGVCSHVMRTPSLYPIRRAPSSRHANVSGNTSSEAESRSSVTMNHMNHNHAAKNYQKRGYRRYNSGGDTSVSSSRADELSTAMSVASMSDMFAGMPFEDHEAVGQFDLLVIGLQEATFGPPSKSSKEEPISLHVNETKRHDMHRQQSREDFGIEDSPDSQLKADRAYLRNPVTGKKIRHLFQSNEWNNGTQYLHALMSSRLPSYTHAVSYQRGQMRLEIYAHGTQVQVEVLHTAAQNTGVAGLANKGGIIAELVINGGTRLSFLTAHLEAHEGAQHYQARCQSLADILDGTKRSIHDVSLTSHYTFVLGDLNFRTELSGAQKWSEEEHKQRVRTLVKQRDWSALNKACELHKALMEKHCLVGFQTLACNFPPTFKVEREKGYTYIDKRRPSYTDRVLWKASDGLNGKIRPLVYEPVDDFASSDHKPVRMAFSLDLNEKIQLRSRVSKRMSTIALVSPFTTKRRQPTSSMSHKQERLNIFVTDLHCSLKYSMESVTKEHMTNLYVSLIADPEGAIRKTLSRKDRLFNKLMFRDGIDSKGFPRSTLRKGSFEPDWGDEEIHAEIKTHTTDGHANDLSGAMLRLTLMDRRASGEDVVMGTYSFNLAHLVQACVPLLSKNKRAAEHCQEKQASEGFFSNISTRGLMPSSMPSMTSLFRHKSDAPTPTVPSSARPFESERGRTASDDDLGDIKSFEVSGPLLKHGKETGWIEATVEAWWLNENAALAIESTGNKSSIPLKNHAARPKPKKPFRMSGRGNGGGRGGGGRGEDRKGAPKSQKMDRPTRRDRIGDRKFPALETVKDRGD